MKAKSIKGTSTAEIQVALAQSMADGFQPTLAIIFLSVSQDKKAISKLFDAYNITIFGATTHGEFTEEEIGEKSIVALLLDMKKEHFKVYYEDFATNPPREVTQEIAKQALKEFNNPSFFIVGSHMETDAEGLLRGFQDSIGAAVEVYGGMAGDDFSFTRQFVFSNHFSSDRGIVAVALDAAKIKIRGRAICGWKPMGIERTVTKSEGNKVFSIDNIPILDITKKFSGIENFTPENEQLFREVSTTFPLQLQRAKGNPVMRPGLILDWEEGSMSCSGTVPQGSKVRFSLPPDFDILEEVIKGCEELKSQKMPQADAVVLFSCAGRLTTFGPLMINEVKGVFNVWKSPMVGMFSNAELARSTDGDLELHTMTTCVVALKEL